MAIGEGRNFVQPEFYINHQLENVFNAKEEYLGRKITIREL
jgi:hypothetical protein